MYGLPVALKVQDVLFTHPTITPAVLSGRQQVHHKRIKSL
jgi:hypothetical protein